MKKVSCNGSRPTIWQLFSNNKLALIGLVVVGLVGFLSVITPLLPLAPPDITTPAQRLKLPLHESYWLGSDHLGRDILSRLLWGTQVSILVGISATFIATLLGSTIGIVAGYAGKITDNILLRGIDMIMAFPYILLALAIVAVLGPGLMNALYAIAIVNIPFFARNIRGVTLGIMHREFIDAAKLSGKGNFQIICSEILPNVLPTIVVTMSTTIGWMILETAGLSFLGLGAQPPQSDLGSMLGEGRKLLFTSPHVSIIPGLMIFILVMGINLVGDGIRDALDPRLKSGALYRPMAKTMDMRENKTVVQTETNSLITVQNLKTVFQIGQETYESVGGVSFSINSGECLGLIGESGSGKSVTALSLLGLVPSPPGRIVDGGIFFENEDLVCANLERLRALRGDKIAYVFQDPMASLHPLFPIGEQIVESIRTHNSISFKQAWKQAIALLDKVKIPNAKERANHFPHQLSGGMRQRVVISMALANQAELLVADEPTTALDVTVQAQILRLLKELQEDKKLSILFITHDFGVVSEICDRVAVMYAGKIVEEGPVDRILAQPSHPYTRKLIDCIPILGQSHKRLVAIPGMAPTANQLPEGCAFSPRCSFANDSCRRAKIDLTSITEDHFVRCLKPLECSS